MTKKMKQIEIDPLLVLGGLYIAADRAPDWVGMRGLDLLAAGFGVASQDWFKDQITAFLGETVTDEVAVAIGGALTVRYGDGIHPAVSKVGQGVLIGLTGNILTEIGMTLQDLLGTMFAQKTQKRLRQSPCPHKEEKEEKEEEEEPMLISAYDYAVRKYLR